MNLREARETLLATLTAAGIDTFYGWGAFSAPCARIFPSEPWVDLEGRAGGKRLQRWEVWAIAGQVDSSATFDDVEALVQQINDAIVNLQGWGYPLWRRPAQVDMGGTRYLGCQGVIETLMEV